MLMCLAWLCCGLLLHGLLLVSFSCFFGLFFFCLWLGLVRLGIVFCFGVLFLLSDWLAD